MPSTVGRVCACGAVLSLVGGFVALSPAAGAGGGSEPSFEPPVSYLAETAINGIVAGDLNNDGIPDMITGNKMAIGGTTGAVAVRLGLGGGTFGGATNTATDDVYGATEGPAIAAGDMNSDGRLDVVAAGANRASVLLGDGNGSLADGIRYPTAGESSLTPGVALGDLNRDGNLDVVTSNASGGAGATSVQLGNGDGTLQAGVLFATGSATKPTTVSLADFNNDGNLDVATAQPEDSTPASPIAVQPGNGDGTLGASTLLAASGGGVAATTGDMNGDGRPDIVTSLNTNQLATYLNNGNGTFAAASELPVEAVGSIATGDVTGDGQADALIAGNDPNVPDESLGVLPGNGNGTYGSEVQFDAGSTLSGLAIADVDSDGYPDALVTSAYALPDPNTSVFLNNIPPAVTTIEPKTGPRDGGTAITIRGRGFSNGTSASIGGEPVSNLAVRSGTRIEGTTPPGAVGAQPVRVTRPDGKSGTLTNGFTYEAVSTSLRVKARKKARKVRVDRSTGLVRRIKTDGTAKARGYCKVNGVRVKWVCDVQIRKRYLRARVQQKAKQKPAVKVTVSCNDRVTVHVKVVANKDGARRTTWKRKWQAKKRPVTYCATNANG